MPDMHIPIETDWVPGVRKGWVQDKGVDQTKDKTRSGGIKQNRTKKINKGSKI